MYIYVHNEFFVVCRRAQTLLYLFHKCVFSCDIKESKFESRYACMIRINFFCDSNAGFKLEEPNLFLV